MLTKESWRRLNAKTQPRRQVTIRLNLVSDDTPTVTPFICKECNDMVCECPKCGQEISLIPKTRICSTGYLVYDAEGNFLRTEEKLVQRKLLVGVSHSHKEPEYMI